MFILVFNKKKWQRRRRINRNYLLLNTYFQKKQPKPKPKNTSIFNETYPTSTTTKLFVSFFKRVYFSFFTVNQGELNTIFKTFQRIRIEHIFLNHIAMFDYMLLSTSGLKSLIETPTLKKYIFYTTNTINSYTFFNLHYSLTNAKNKNVWIYYYDYHHQKNLTIRSKRRKKLPFT